MASQPHHGFAQNPRRPPLQGGTDVTVGSRKSPNRPQNRPQQQWGPTYAQANSRPVGSKYEPTAGLSAHQSFTRQQQMQQYQQQQLQGHMGDSNAHYHANPPQAPSPQYHNFAFGYEESSSPSPSLQPNVAPIGSGHPYPGPSRSPQPPTYPAQPQAHGFQMGIQYATNPPRYQYDSYYSSNGLDSNASELDMNFSSQLGREDYYYTAPVAERAPMPTAPWTNFPADRNLTESRQNSWSNFGAALAEGSPLPRPADGPGGLTSPPTMSTSSSGTSSPTLLTSSSTDLADIASAPSSTSSSPVLGSRRGLSASTEALPNPLAAMASFKSKTSASYGSLPRVPGISQPESSSLLRYDLLYPDPRNGLSYSHHPDDNQSLPLDYNQSQVRKMGHMYQPRLNTYATAPQRRTKSPAANHALDDDGELVDPVIPALGQLQIGTFVSVSPGPPGGSTITKQVGPELQTMAKVQWLFKTNNAWMPMDPQIASTIEKAYQKGHTVSGNYQIANGKYYFVDFHSFQQIDMLDSSHKRAVRRNPAEGLGTIDTDPSPTPFLSTSSPPSNPSYTIASNVTALPTTGSNANTSVPSTSNNVVPSTTEISSPAAAAPPSSSTITNPAPAAKTWAMLAAGGGK